MDLSVYLVTDSSPAILRGRDLCEVVQDAIQGGKFTLNGVYSVFAFLLSCLV